MQLFRVHGEPAYIRSDNGTEFIAQVVHEGLTEAGVSTLFVAPGSPWENGYSEQRAQGRGPGRAVPRGIQSEAVAHVSGLSHTGGVRGSLRASGSTPSRCEGRF